MSGYEIGPDGKLRKKQDKKSTSSNVTWGIPQGTSSFPMPSMNTANSTPAVGSNVAKNPTAGTMTPSSPGATSLATSSNAPASSSITSPTSSLSPAGQSYASQLAEIMKGANNLQTAFSTYKANQNQPKPEPEKKEESEYLKYLRSMFNPEEARRAQENINSLNQRTADEIAREKKEQERIQKNEAGMVERGQDYLSRGEARASAETLANLAISKGYNTDILNSYLNAGATLYEAEEALRKEGESPLTIEEAQALGVPFGTTMAEARQLGIIPSGSTEVGGVNDATVFAYADLIGKGQMDISNVPEEYRGAVAQAVGLQGDQPQMSSYMRERVVRNLNSIDDLMGQISGWTTGAGSLLSVIPGTSARNFAADVNTLSANIAFGELTAMREASKTGGALGQVSERELALLEAALGSLDRAQSPAQFKESLENIKESIERWQAAVDEYGGFEASSDSGEGGLYDF